MKKIIHIHNKEYTYDSINQTLKIEEGGKIIFNKSLHVVKKYKNLKNIVEEIKKSIPDNILELRFKCYNSLPNQNKVLIDNNKIKYVKIRFTLMSPNKIKKELIINNPGGNSGKPKRIKEFRLSTKEGSTILEFSINKKVEYLFPCNRYPESIIEQIDRIENQIKQRQRRDNRNDEQDEEKEEPINIYDLDDPTPPDDAMDIDDPTPPDDPMRGLE